MFMRDAAERMLKMKRSFIVTVTSPAGRRRMISLNSLPGTTPRPCFAMDASMRVTMVMRSSEQVRMTVSSSVSTRTPSRIGFGVRADSALVAICRPSSSADTGQVNCMRRTSYQVCCSRNIYIVVVVGRWKMWISAKRIAGLGFWRPQRMGKNSGKEWSYTHFGAAKM